MIRFINLTDQINEDKQEFAFFDTVIDKFVEFNGSQTWDCLEDFVDDYNVDGGLGEFPRYYNLMTPNFTEGYDILYINNRKVTVVCTRTMKIETITSSYSQSDVDYVLNSMTPEERQDYEKTQNNMNSLPFKIVHIKTK